MNGEKVFAELIEEATMELDTISKSDMMQVFKNAFGHLSEHEMRIAFFAYLEGVLYQSKSELKNIKAIYEQTTGKRG